MCKCAGAHASLCDGMYSVLVRVNDIVTTPTTRSTALLAVQVHVGRVFSAFPCGGPITTVGVVVRATG